MLSDPVEIYDAFTPDLQKLLPYFPTALKTSYIFRHVCRVEVVSCRSRLLQTHRHHCIADLALK